MADPLACLYRFFAEMKRRKVYRVGVAHLVVAFVVLQLAETDRPSSPSR